MVNSQRMKTGSHLVYPKDIIRYDKKSHADVTDYYTARSNNPV